MNEETQFLEYILTRSSTNHYSGRGLGCTSYLTSQEGLKDLGFKEEVDRAVLLIDDRGSLHYYKPEKDRKSLRNGKINVQAMGGDSLDKLARDIKEFEGEEPSIIIVYEVYERQLIAIAEKLKRIPRKIKEGYH